MALFDNLFGKGKTFSDRMRYVEDFRIEESLDERGKMHRKAVYIGNWTVLRKTGSGALAKLIASAALAAAAAVLLVRTMLLTHASSGSLFVMIPLAAALFPALYLVMGAFSLPYRQKPMRRDRFMHGITRMQRSSVAVIALAAVSLIVSFIYRAVVGDWMFFKEDRLFIALCIGVGICCAGVLILLGSLETEERPNGDFANS